MWNRLHAAFFIRFGPDGRSYGKDRLEPLLWYHSKFLLEGKAAGRAEAVLEEFLRNQGRSLIEEPVKRAILQRDLWLVSNWLAGKRDDDARQRISPLLAKVIRQLPLTSEQIAKLPGNYEATVASKKHAARFDALKPQQPYLPDDLFKTDGPWVSLGRTDGLTAPFHVREVTNSVFLIFLKLPGGRDKTLAFLKALAAFDKPMFLANNDEKNQRSFTYLPNPAQPKWPKGTEVALVRRALLIDSSRRVVASPLTESVQLRTMITEAPALTRELLNKTSARAGTSGQVFAEFQLRRAELIGGTAGVCAMSPRSETLRPGSTVTVLMISINRKAMSGRSHSALIFSRAIGRRALRVIQRQTCTVSTAFPPLPSASGQPHQTTRLGNSNHSPWPQCIQMKLRRRSSSGRKAKIVGLLCENC